MDKKTLDWKQTFKKDLEQEEYHTKVINNQLSKEEKDRLEATRKLFDEDISDLFVEE